MNQNDETNKGAVLLRRHHDITPFCSTDAARYVLLGVHYHPAKGILEASNGKVAIRVPVERQEEKDLPAGLATGETAPPAECIIPAGTLIKAIKNIPNGSTPPPMQVARLDTPTNNSIALTTTDLENDQAIKVRPIDGQFPNIDQVWPTRDTVVEMAFDPELLAVVVNYAKKHGTEKARSLKLTVHRGSLDKDGQSVIGPVEFSVVVSTDPLVQAKGVLMPMRLS